MFERTKYYFMIMLLSAGVFGYVAEVCAEYGEDFFLNLCGSRNKGLLATGVLTFLLAIASFTVSFFQLNKVVEIILVCVTFVFNTATTALATTAKNAISQIVHELCWASEFLIVLSFFSLLSTTPIHARGDEQDVEATTITTDYTNPNPVTQQHIKSPYQPTIASAPMPQTATAEATKINTEYTHPNPVTQQPINSPYQPTVASAPMPQTAA